MQVKLNWAERLIKHIPETELNLWGANSAEEIEALDSSVIEELALDLGPFLDKLRNEARREGWQACKGAALANNKGVAGLYLDTMPKEWNQ